MFVMMVTLSSRSLPYFLLALINSSLGDGDGRIIFSKNDDDSYDVIVNSDLNDDVPRWLFGSSFFGLPYGWRYNDDITATIRMDRDRYQIVADLRFFEGDSVKVKITSGNSITVYAKQKYRNEYGRSTSKSFNRKFSVPRTYNVNRMEARLSSSGVLTINVPNDRDRDTILFSNSGYRNIYY
ncbi:alpha-crystallin B chain-like [Cylas formicarius]|uniref:alpha-crystallin B chain-like n=1 Tax=Cylas formicarius TaxID=197179 RepID=UPI002958CA10|nr:alpha-crystallin B chain-like [Cylas formicarius]